MPTTTELAAARENLGILLEEMRLAGHRFEVSPADEDHWHVDVECSAGDGWLKVELRLPRAELVNAPTDSHARGRVLETLEERLRGCRHAEA